MGGYRAPAAEDVCIKYYQTAESAEAVARMYVMTMIDYPVTRAEGLRHFTNMLSVSNLTVGIEHNGRQQLKANLTPFLIQGNR